MLREVTVKIGLERIDTQEGMTVEAMMNEILQDLINTGEVASFIDNTI